MLMPEIEQFVLTTQIRNISYGEIILKKNFLKTRFFNCQIVLQSKYISLRIESFFNFFP